ncbi:MAG TPA: hypothetical protein VL099_13180 [Candidatus Binatia bacterium]|nr:hypothetical protein [Candidatus Binatia bacterium]
MKPSSHVFFPLAFLALLCGAAAPAAAQDAASASLRTQLLAQYKLARLATSGAGISVLDQGALLVVQKTGIFVVPPASVSQCGETYKDNELKAGASICRGMFKNTSRFLEVGERVLLYKLDVSVKDEKVSLVVMACEACSGQEQSTYYKGVVNFVYPKGYLESADPGQVEDVISEVLPLASVVDAAQQQQPQQEPAAQQAAAAPAAPGGGPGTVQLGQTPEEVLRIMGTPDKIINLGPTLIYLYKNIKITFKDGRVSDAQ